MQYVILFLVLFNFKYFYQLFIFERVLDFFKVLVDNKKNMINRLNNNRFYHENSFLGEPHLEDGIITKSGKKINSKIV